MSEGDTAKPLYAVVKDHVTARIRDGTWPPGTRIPSENALGPLLGVSRITVNRAFAELAQAGLLRKVVGVGTFVAPPPPRPRFGLTTIHDIAEEIAARGLRWSCRVLALAQAALPADAAAALDLPAGRPVPHSAILHLADGLPIQQELRWLRPGYAPGYLDQDHAAGTTFAHLLRAGRATEMEQAIGAILPDPALARLLQVSRREPCLEIRRTTFTDDVPMTFSRLLQPASRFEISGRARLEPA